MSRNACNAVMADVGTAAASTTDRLGGTDTRLSAGTQAYSASVPAVLQPNNLVTGAESGDILPDRCNHAGEVPARDAVARPAEPERQAHHVRLTGHDDVVAGMH